MQRGGDNRLIPLPGTSLTKYRVASEPRNTVPLGSCTASSPSHGALAASERALGRLREAADPSVELEALMASHRRRLGHLFELEAGPTVVLAPSGTDAVYLVSALALRFGERVHHVVVGASELGGGTVRASRGLGISEDGPFGPVGVDAPVAGLSDCCTAEPVYLRDPSGVRHEPGQVDEDVRARVMRAARDSVVVLHLVAHSKTGLRAPSASLCARLKQELGDKLVVLVDAAQGRLAPRDVRNALDLGFVVLFTGSKFYSGPPFSCALVLPTELATDPGPLPAGLDDWLSRADLPSHWTRARASLSHPNNPGLGLRWEAALHEIESYHAIKPRYRGSVYHIFAGSVYSVFGPSQVLEIDVPVPPVHQLVTALGAYPSVFGFGVRTPEGTLLGAEQLLKLHALADTDLGAEDPVLGGCFHLGQPVSLGPPGPDRVALLRVTLGARLVTEHALTDDCGGAFLLTTMLALRAKLERLVAERAWETR